MEQTKRADLASLQPLADAVLVERMLTKKKKNKCEVVKKEEQKDVKQTPQVPHATVHSVFESPLLA